MRRWIILVLLANYFGMWLSMPKIGYAQQPLGSLTLPSTTVATDGEFIAWTVPATNNGGVSAIYAGTLRDNPLTTATLIATESEPEITTLLLSDGIVVWATPASAGKLTLRARNIRGGESVTVATDAQWPTMIGATLFWWDLQGQAGGLHGNGTATIMRRDLRTLDAPQTLHQVPFGLVYPGPLRVSDRWVAWTTFQGLAYGEATWSLYVLPIGAAQERLVQENFACSGSLNYYDRYVLWGDTLSYSTVSCYRGPQNDGKLTILDLTTDQRQISGPHNNITLFSAGRYLFWNTYHHEDTSQVDLWGFDPQTISAFRLGDNLTPIAFDDGMLFWAKREGNGTSVSFAPLTQLLPNVPRSLDDPLVVGRRFFPETSHTLAGSFHDYWVHNGGLPVFGFPITEEFIQQSPDATQGYPVQYFERQRFEYHSEHRGTPYEVLLGRLGAEALARSGRVWQSFPTAAPSTPHYFPQTGQAIAPEFWDYWRTHGLEFGDPRVSEREALALWGLPISPPLQERLETGETLLVQWFERARFEYHPGNPDPYKVLLGRLAVETVDGFSWR